MKKSILFLVFVCAQTLWGAEVSITVEKAKSVAGFNLGVGSEVTLESPIPEQAGPAIYLGKATMPDGKDSYQMFLHKRSEKFLFFKPSDIDMGAYRAQSILNPYEQAGGTCTGYAIFGFLTQTHMSGFSGTGVLAKKLSDEKGRTTLLVDNINEYYLTPLHRYSIQGILNKYGKQFGFSCKTYKYETYERLKGRIVGQTGSGLPVVVSFNIGPNMYKSPFELKPVNDSTAIDQRLWLPRREGERNAGGHTVVAAAAFEYNSKTYLIMLDSDWAEPRVWDMEAFLNDPKTATNEIELTVCK